MTLWNLLALEWDWEPSIVFGCLALALAYAWSVRFRLERASAYYFAGVLLILLALVSPLDTLADTYLFSAHMLQHLILALAIPPLLLLGLPAEVAKRVLSFRWIARAERLLRRPPVAWAFGIGAMAFWHLPAMFNAALANPGLHIFQHLSFLVSGTIFWWPILSPVPSSRTEGPAAIGYLFVACLACTVIGILLTFSPATLFPAYIHPAGSPAAIDLIRNDLGISAETDHQIGGLFMWVLGCLTYLCASLAMFARWHSSLDAAGVDAVALGGGL